MADLYSNVVRTGPVTSSDGAINITRGGKSGEASVADAHARYTEANYRGQMFMACNTALQALSLNSTTATGLILSNPAGSNKLIVLQRILVALASLPAGGATLIITGNANTVGAATVHTTPLVPQSALLGSGISPVAKVDSAATIAAATIFRTIGGGPAATVAASTSFPAHINDEVAGEIILQPGTCISLQCLTTAISVMATFVWEEIPQ